MIKRKEAGLSQDALAEQLGISRQAVSKWETGEADPDIVYVMQMCEIFGISSYVLLFGEERRPKTDEVSKNIREKSRRRNAHILLFWESFSWFWGPAALPCLGFYPRCICGRRLSADMLMKDFSALSSVQKRAGC